jgi:DNA-binding response OmpR family regulator
VIDETVRANPVPVDRGRTAAVETATVLVIEDDPVLRGVLDYNLTREGFRVLTAAGGEAGLRQAREAADALDVIVLDVMLPGISGFQVLRLLRSETDVPVLILSARGEEQDRIDGLELGADDYVAKPFVLRTAKITIQTADQAPLKPLVDIPRMSEIARAMLHDAITAFIEDDQTAARAIVARDDEVDALYEQIYRELLTFMLADPTTIDQATHLLWAAHNLERIADRVTNICERVVFAATGQLEELAVSTY